jgi:acetylornithine/succinyldiaminopimelate/putrescine aminotransferase
MTATAQPKKHIGFEPMLPGFVYVPFNDVDALQKAFTDDVAAVMIEPIQGEGGINIATPEYMSAIRQLCDKNQAVMILDEVQTGMGRTGKWFGYQRISQLRLRPARTHRPLAETALPAPQVLR